MGLMMAHHALFTGNRLMEWYFAFVRPGVGAALAQVFGLVAHWLLRLVLVGVLVIVTLLSWPDSRRQARGVRRVYGENAAWPVEYQLRGLKWTASEIGPVKINSPDLQPRRRRLR
jgi:hypothetical protein